MTSGGQTRRLLGKQGNELAEGIVQELDILHKELASLRQELAELRGTPASEDLGALGPVMIEAGDQLGVEQGFYTAEKTDTGATFNWSGPSPQFSFDVLVDRTHGAELRLEAINFLDYDRQKDVKLFVDGLEVPVSVAKSDPGIVVAGNLPSRAQAGKSYLTFLLPEALPPPGEEDKRTLGLAFVRLTVTPRE